MWSATKKILIGLGWAIALTMLLGLIAVNWLVTAMYYYNFAVPGNLYYSYAVASTVLYLVFFPIMVVVFSILEFKSKLPRFHFQEKYMIRYPAFLISFRRILSALLWWLLFGIAPFLVAIYLLASSPKIMVYVPGLGLYLEITLLYMLYRSLIVKAPPLSNGPSLCAAEMP